MLTVPKMPQWDMCTFSGRPLNKPVTDRRLTKQLCMIDKASVSFRTDFNSLTEEGTRFSRNNDYTQKTIGVGAFLSSFCKLRLAQQNSVASSRPPAGRGKDWQDERLKVLVLQAVAHPAPY